MFLHNKWGKSEYVYLYKSRVNFDSITRGIYDNHQFSFKGSRPLGKPHLPWYLFLERSISYFGSYRGSYQVRTDSKSVEYLT